MRSLMVGSSGSGGASKPEAMNHCGTSHTSAMRCSVASSGATSPRSHRDSVVTVPAALAERAERVLIGLRAIQQRVSPHSAPPTLCRVGLAMRAFPDLDHLHIVQRLEMWAMEPKRLAGRHRHGRDLDIPGLFLEFCRRAQSQTRPVPGVVQSPVVSGRAVLEAQAAARRASHRAEAEEVPA